MHECLCVCACMRAWLLSVQHSKEQKAVFRSVARIYSGIDGKRQVKQWGEQNRQKKLLNFKKKNLGMWEGQSRNMRRLMGEPWNRPATGVTASKSNHYFQTHIYPHYDLRNSFSLLVLSKLYSATDTILSSDNSDPLTSHTLRLMLTSHQVLGSSVGYPT